MECAGNDLKASKTLYSTGDYPNAIFHLQQSVEKATKAYALSIGLFKVDELKGVGHDTPEVFLKLLAKKGILQSIDMLNRISSAEIDKSKNLEIREIIKKIKKTETKVKVAKLTKEQIQGNLQLCKTIDEFHQKIKRDLASSITPLKSLSSEMSKIIGTQLDEAGLSIKSKDLDKIIRNEFDKIKPEFLDWASKFTRMFILSVVTYPHAIFARYPDGEIKPKDYRRGLGIVDEIESVLKELEDCVQFYQ